MIRTNTCFLSVLEICWRTKTFCRCAQRLDNIKIISSTKKGRAFDFNNWRGINLLDVASKVERIAPNGRIKKLLEKNWNTLRFRATPRLVTQISVIHKEHSTSKKREWNRNFQYFHRFSKSLWQCQKRCYYCQS